MSPFVTLKCGNQAFSTPVHRNGHRDPSWEHSVSFNFDGAADGLHFTVQHDGKTKGPVTVGCVDLLWKDIQFNTSKWYNIFSVANSSKVQGQLNVTVTCDSAGALALQALTAPTDSSHTAKGAAAPPESKLELPAEREQPAESSKWTSSGARVQILGSGERTLPARVQTRVFEFLTGGGCETLKSVCRALRDQLREFIELRYASTYDREGFNSSGFHRLHVLAAKGDVDGLEELFATRSDLDVDVRSRAVACRGVTPLMRAAQFANLRAMQFLLEQKADVTAADPAGWTALHWSPTKRPDYAELLLDARAEINRATNSGETFLMAAADELSGGGGADLVTRFNESALVQLLLKRKADPNLRSARGKTAVQIVEQGGEFRFYRVG